MTSIRAFNSSSSSSNGHCGGLVLGNVVQSSWWWRFIVIVFILAMSIIFWVGRNDANSMRSHHGSDNDFHRMYASTLNSKRCVDDEDPPNWTTKDDVPCTCPDPSRAKPRIGVQKWMTQHNRMVKAATFAAATESGLDFVMIGDSITERFMGTRSMGANPAPEFKQVFDEFFDQSQGGGGTLQGLALGSSGDICTELKWHLENGMLPDTLNPKVWIILIGTNDLDRSRCSKRNTLAGILNVAHYLHEHRPNTPILLHGLLPRADEFNTGNYTLGIRWMQIMWINRELKKFCDLHQHWHYMESNNLFLERNTDGKNVDENIVVINAELMEDSLHPSVQGYKVWAPRIAEYVQKIINGQDDSSTNENEHQ